ncbi:MAG TPA: hypothetical protein PKN13_01325 [Accumulibacter sp.]|nr:hypothetical protein [Accumulibacter sp.]HMW16449.1 hypothetical protein [Accumulibacter sp.]HMX22485.1 hypothetical protein [Accumulibacter sp.]HNC18964.1 hypothetical protein [Accumulibacter sp.]HND80555.1 hypothetical protein [Accumulibacter sp.]
MKKLTTSLAILSTVVPLAGSLQAAHAGILVDLEVVDRQSGQKLEVYRHRGQHYVVGAPGHRYAVILRNKTGGRVMTVLSVDGINALSGQTAATGQTGYVLGAWQKAEIDGWRKSLDDVAAFYFTSIADSYAGRTDRPDNVGVIGVAVYREAPPPAVSVAPSHRDMPSAAENKTAGAAPASAPVPTPAPAAAPPLGDQGRARQESADSSRRLGTGHGERIVSPTQYTDFKRASESPAEIVSIRYDSHANLLAQGIIPRRKPHSTPSPDPFPGGFTPDPPR